MSDYPRKSSKKSRGDFRKQLNPKGLRPRGSYLASLFAYLPLQGFRPTERMLTAFQPKHRRPANLTKDSPLAFVGINEG